MRAVGFRMVTTFVVHPIYGYVPERDGPILQTTRKVGDLIGTILNAADSGPDSELEQRQRELYHLVKKILTKKKYIEARGVVIEMFRRVKNNNHFAFLDEFPVLNRMT